MIRALAVLLVLLVQEDNRVLEQVERLSGPWKERKAATEALLKMKREDPGIIPELRKLLQEEVDPRVCARLEYILDAVEIRESWSRSLKTPSRFIAVGGEVVAVQSSDGEVHVYSQKKGSKRWSKPGDGPWVGFPCLSDDHLFAVVQEKREARIRQFTLKNGRRTTIGKGVRPYNYGRSLLVDGRHVVFTPDTVSLLSYDLKTRKLTLVSKNAYPFMFAVTDGKVLYADRKGKLICHDLGRRKPLWTSEEGEAFQVLAATPERVVTMDGTGTLRGWNMKDGTLDWSTREVNRMRGFSTTRLVSDRLVIRSATGGMDCVDITSGRKLWSTEDGSGRALFSPPVVVAGCVVVQDAGGLKFHDLESGAEIRVNANPVDGVLGMAGDGNRLFVTSASGLQAVEIFR